MKYISTRGACPEQNFEEVLLAGMAPDGGLYVPAELPQFTMDEIRSWKSLPYPELALKIITPFIGDEIEAGALRKIIEESYDGFDVPDVAPLNALNQNEWLLELYHGPTLAFKDFALQVLGRLLDHVLRKNDQRVVILGATSGDTGSAALEGCRHSDRVNIYILHPHQRVSDVQRRQMTTIAGDNVFNLAVEGNFDDCQRLVKAAFADQSFLPSDRQLVAVNSINWARIMMQIVYYFSAALKLGGPDQTVSFSVPTGNFGDIYAGCLARRMGLPIAQLIVATNENDILHRFISRNEYAVSELTQTYSPSMDILISSNFERYLFELFARNGAELTEFMARLGANPGIENETTLGVSEQQWQQMRACFDSASVDDETTCDIIAEVFASHGIVLDPHTAVGVKAGRLCNQDPAIPMVMLATAHPAKFGDAIAAAGVELPALPRQLQDLFDLEERYTVIANDLQAVTDYLKNHS